MNWAVFRFVLWLVMVGAGGAAAAISKVEPTWTFLGTIVTLTGFVGAYLETPASAKRQLDQLRTRVADLTAKLGKTSGPGGSALAIACIVGALALGGGNAGCTPAQQAVLGRLGQVVLDDLGAGKSAEQIEEDLVAVACPAGATHACIDGVVVLNDILQGLLDLGIIPPHIIPKAKTMLAQVRPMALAHQAARAAQDGGAP